MANQNDKNLKDLINSDDQASKAIRGTDSSLDLEDIELRDLIRQTTNRSTLKYSSKVEGRNLDYFTQIGLATMLQQGSVDSDDPIKKKEAKENPEKYLKKYMSDKNITDATALFMSNISKKLAYSNYEAIYKHIPECSTAIQVYVDNILSPDDFSKSIFDFKYDNSVDNKKEERINKEIDQIIKRYKLNLKTEQIIRDALIYGDAYYAVLSLEDEMEMMIHDVQTNGGVLHEDLSFYDLDRKDITIDANDIELNEEEKAAFVDFFKLSNITYTKEQSKALNEEVATQLLKEDIANFVNDHFKIGSKKELLQERVGYEMEQAKNKIFDVDASIGSKKKTKSSKTKTDDKPMYLNGSVLRKLEADHVISLDVDDINYGYYYIEEKDYQSTVARSAAGDYLGMVSGRSQDSNIQMTAAGATLPIDRNVGTPSDLDDMKMKLISDIFINTISKKIDKEYVRHNKELKEFLYGIIRHEYITKKQVTLTYFTPEEVVHFECEPIFKNIVFFAKLYLAQLTNMIVIAMGRGHDKRMINVVTGLDSEAEQAVSNVIESIKTKEFRLSNTDINTILSLNPGALDDYIIPVINGEPMVTIDTLPGMDADISNNNFLDWLRRSMLNGMHIPAALIDSMNELDFARSLSAQNGNFIRSVTRYQMVLTEGFNKLIRRLYANEYKFLLDGDAKINDDIDINKIEIMFPSPASLVMDNLYNRITTTEQIADSLSQILVPSKQDGTTEDLRQEVKSELFKKWMPNVINWEEMQEVIENKLKVKASRKSVEDSLKPQEEDQYTGY